MKRLIQLYLVLMIPQICFGGDSNSGKYTLPLNSTDNLEFINVVGSVVEYQGQTALRVVAKPEADMTKSRETLVIISDKNFQNGTIELEVAGAPLPDAPAQARGFVGLAFHLNEAHVDQYECIYLRPKNGRAKTQIQRNHSVQYTSHPDYPWHRLRKETPGVYESYVDLVPGEWTRMRIVVAGNTAKLYVHDNEQPNLLVNDLKLGESEGRIALWINKSTIAHFRNLVVIDNK